MVASAGEPLGVDIEARISAPRHALAEQILDPDCLQAWRNRPAEADSLLTQAWCAREAVLKFDGRGLRIEPRSLRLDLDLPCWASWDDGRLRAHVQALPAPEGYHACLASARALQLSVDEVG